MALRRTQKAMNRVPARGFRSLLSSSDFDLPLDETTVYPRPPSLTTGGPLRVSIPLKNAERTIGGRR